MWTISLAVALTFGLLAAFAAWSWSSFQRELTISWVSPARSETNEPGRLVVFGPEADPEGYILRWGLVDHKAKWQVVVKAPSTSAKIRCRPGLYYTFCTAYNQNGESDFTDVLLFEVPSRAQAPRVRSVKLWQARNDIRVVIHHEASTNGLARPADCWVQRSSAGPRTSSPSR